MSERPRVLLIGGGFGGLNAAQALEWSPVDVTLVDRQNFHLFSPLLYQVATGGLSPANIASPLRYVLRKQRNASVILGEVVDFDPQGRVVQLQRQQLPYDYLVVATGSRANYFGHDGWEESAPGLKGVEDAREIRSRVLSAFEAAERATDLVERERCLTFVVVGGGPTGVELAGAVAELARETLRNDFRRVDTTQTRVVLIEGGPRVLPSFSEKLSAKAAASLERLGVEVQTDAMVADIADHSVLVRRKGVEERVETRTSIWAAGVRASSLGQSLASKTGVALDSAGRVLVESDCSIAGHPEIFVIGDLASLARGDGRPLPGIAPVAMQQGRHVARVIDRKVRSKATPGAFCYRDKGDLATIGRSSAVARVGRFEFSGYPAWVVWLVVHVMYLVEFQNRLLVLFQWGWNYVTWNRSARLITSAREEVSHGGGGSPPGDVSQPSAGPAESAGLSVSE